MTDGIFNGAETSTTDEWVVQPGTDVFGSDEKKVGEVDDIQDGYLVVRKGFFFPKDHYIPFSAIASHTDDRIYLNVSADDATSQQWDVEPTGTGAGTVGGTTAGATTTGSAYAANDYDNAAVPGTTAAYADSADVDLDRDTAVGTTGTAGTTGYADTAAYADTASGTARDDVPFEHENRGTGHIDEADDIAVPVVQEELEATTRGVERGRVHVDTRVTEAEQTLEVPVVEERVRVERVAVDRDATAADLSQDGATIDVPVYGEEVDVEKRARVVEEVRVSKDAVTDTRRVSDTVRREDVDVVDETVDTTIDGTTTGRRTDTTRG